MVLAVYAIGVVMGAVNLIAAPPSLPTMDLEPNPQPARLVVTGLPDAALRALAHADWTAEQWRQLLEVRLAETADDASLPPLLGTYRIEVESGRLIFRPRFGFSNDRTYVARLNLAHLPGGSAAREIVEKQFTFGTSLPPSPMRAATRVVDVFPTSDRLPENQLKFYIHFSAPMSRGEAYRHIRLLDDQGKEVEYPFLELPEELWDPELLRFTLLFDPGRIKRGLKPREQFGPALRAGQRYTLVIRADWRDGQGRPLAEEYRKTFQVDEPDDTQPDPSKWQLNVPQRQTRQPLKVQFEEPLDHGLLQRMLWVVDAKGRVVDGESIIERGERAWQFIPAESWRDEPYQLVVDTRLEDRAGNSIARPFEVDLFETVEREVVHPTLAIPFRAR